MAQNLTYSYLVAWIIGGLILLTMLLLRSARRPLWLSTGLMAFGAAGVLSLGLGLASWQLTLGLAVLAAGLGAAVGYGIRRLA